MKLWSRILNIILRDTKGTRDVDDAMANRFVRERLDMGYQAWTRSSDPEGSWKR